MGYATEAAYENTDKVPYQKKKPWFLKRWVINWVREDWDNAKSPNMSLNVSRPIGIAIDADSDLDRERALRFNVYVANGGRVVETFRYDRQKDRNTKSLYIITNDADFGREIDKIITMEALR